MATTREILFSARDNGVENTMSRIRRSAKELSSELMRESSKSSSTQKDLLSHYEQQIRLIERRNKTEQEGSKLEARNRLDRVALDPSSSSAAKQGASQAYRSEISKINKGSKEDELQVKILREIADALKLETRRESEQAVRMEDDDLSRKRGGGPGGTGGGPGGSGEGGGPRDRDRGREGRGSQMDVAGYLMGAQQFMGAQSMSGMATGVGGAMMGMGGGAAKVGKLMSYIGMIGEIANMSQDATADLEKNMMQMSAMTGVSATSINAGNIGDDVSRYGYSRNEYLSSILPQQMVARGSTSGADTWAKNSMMTQRGSGVNMGTIMELERMSSRSMAPGAGSYSTNLISRMVESHSKTQAFKDEKGGFDFTRLQESMGEFVSMQKNVMMRTGGPTSMNNALFLAGKLEEIGGTYKDDQMKWSTVQAMDRGLTSQSSPESTAVKMGILRKAMPDATYSQLQEEMQKGIDSDYLMKGMFDFVGETGGTDDAKSILMQELTGGQMRWSDTNKMTAEKNKSIRYGMSATGAYTGTSTAVEEELERRAGGAVSSDVAEQIRRPERTSDIKQDPIDKLLEGWGAIFETFEEKMEGWFSTD